MAEEERIHRITSVVADALLNKGEGYSVAELVADNVGEGTEPDNDPYYVWDRHFLNDVARVSGWPDEKRDPDEVSELMDTFEEYWLQNPDKRFCQIVCKAHTRQNGLGDFDPEDTVYEEPLRELTDEQLLEYLQSQIEGDEDEQ